MTRRPPLDRVASKALSRGDVRSVGMACLQRMFMLAYHMHEVLRLHPGDGLSVQVGMRQYVIALATHLETFFRDLIRALAEADTDGFARLVSSTDFQWPADVELTARGLTRYDF